MFLIHEVDLVVYLSHFSTRFLDCRHSFAVFSLPALDILCHFVVSTLLLLNVFAQFTNVLYMHRFINQLQSTRLSDTILFIALLAKVTPAPVLALPFRLIEVAHGSLAAKVGKRAEEGSRGTQP